MSIKSKPLAVSQSEAATIDKALTHWVSQGLVTEVQQIKLHNALLVEKRDWNRLAKYAFWLAVVCTLIAFASILSLDSVADILVQLGFGGSAILFSVLAGALYALGYQIARYRVEDRYRSGACYLLAAVCTQLATGNGMIYWANINMHWMSFEQFVPLLIAHNIMVSLVFAGLGVAVQSVMLWVFALWSRGNSIGLVSSTYLYGSYILAVHLPEVTVCYGAALLGLASILNNHGRLQRFFTSTVAMGLLYGFGALWVLSLHHPADTWLAPVLGDGIIGTFFWSLLLFLAACASLWHGLKYDWALTRGFGITFLGVVLITKYCELFWPIMPKIAFFSILAGVFWALGVYAEQVMSALEETVKRNDP